LPDINYKTEKYSMNEVLDRINILILRELQKDAKLTTKELAAKVNLSPSPTFERQKRLEREGYIQRYIAVVDPIKVGNGIMVLCNVRLKHHSKEFSRQFTSVIAGIDEVVECFNTSGEYDYMLKIYARDMRHYQDFILGTLGDLDCIGSLHSIFVIGEVKNTLSVPI
jgi:Lrp/AsnC family leucine-responsive transcriptional regulator